MKPNRAFYKLRKVWYKKLKDSGFDDIEDESLYHLKTWSYIFAKSYNTHYFYAKQEYYYQAEHFLNTHDFAYELERFIWSLHADGISHRTISKTVEDTGLKIDRNRVRRTIARLRAIMGVQYGWFGGKMNIPIEAYTFIPDNNEVDQYE